MFKRKTYKITFLSQNWDVRHIQELLTVPKKGELIYFENQYYDVIQVIHNLAKSHIIFVIIEESEFQIKNIS